MPSAKARASRVDIAGDEARGFGIGAADDDRWHTHGAGRKAGRGEASLMLRGWDQNPASEVAALLFRRELVIEVDACRV
jgi:hypothetical protein